MPLIANIEVGVENAVLDNFAEENAAIECLDEQANENIEQEGIIPSNQQNPVVMLDPIFELNPEEIHGMDPMVERANPSNVEKNPLIKYEIQHDFDEINMILEDPCTNQFGKCETGSDRPGHAIDTIGQTQPKQKTVPSSQGRK